MLRKKHATPKYAQLKVPNITAAENTHKQLNRKE
jgi:hypothetical protein